jgi:nicotinamidase-related amidase
MQVELASSVLVVVDMQHGFVRPKSAHVVPAVVDLVARWQAAGGATVWTRFFNEAGSNFRRLIHWDHLAGSPETDIVDELQPYVHQATAVVDKPGYTLFTPQGAGTIAAGGWTDLVICGLATESCVCKTAVDAFERDLTPWVVTDACGSHAGAEAHEAGLLVTRRFIGRGQMVTSTEVLSALRVPTTPPA